MKIWMTQIHIIIGKLLFRFGYAMRGNEEIKQTVEERIVFLSF